MLDTIREQQNEYPISSRQKLYKYVSICIGFMFLFLITFPIAVWRVSRSGKYNAGAFNSLTIEQSQKSEFETNH